MIPSRPFPRIVLVALLTVAALAGLFIATHKSSAQEIAIQKYNVKFSMPKGWKLKTNEPSKDGAWCVIQQEAKVDKGPIIILWFGEHPQTMGQMLGLSPLETLVRSSLAGIDIEASTKDYKLDSANLFKQTTKHIFADWKSPDSTLVVSMLTQSDSSIRFIISVAAPSDRIAETKTLADDIAGTILRQLTQKTKDTGQAPK